MRLALAVFLGVLGAHVCEMSAFLFPVSAGRVPSRVTRLGAHDVLVTLLDGEVRKVTAQEDENLLDALEAHDIDAPHSCRAGLCTE